MIILVVFNCMECSQEHSSVPRAMMLPRMLYHHENHLDNHQRNRYSNHPENHPRNRQRIIMNFIKEIIREYLEIAFTEDFALYGCLWYWPLFLLLGFNMAIFITLTGMVLGVIGAIILTIIQEWPVNHHNNNTVDN